MVRHVLDLLHRVLSTGRPLTSCRDYDTPLRFTAARQQADRGGVLNYGNRGRGDGDDDVLSTADCGVQANLEDVTEAPVKEADVSNRRNKLASAVIDRMQKVAREGKQRRTESDPSTDGEPPLSFVDCPSDDSDEDLNSTVQSVATEVMLPVVAVVPETFELSTPVPPPARPTFTDYQRGTAHVAAVVSQAPTAQQTPITLTRKTAVTSSVLLTGSIDGRIKYDVPLLELSPHAAEDLFGVVPVTAFADFVL